MAKDHTFFANGINVNGEYLLKPSIRVFDVANAARGNVSRKSVDERTALHIKKPGHMKVAYGIDAATLEQTGWGVIFPLGIDPAIKEAIEPLLTLRLTQATKINEQFYKEYTYHPGMSTKMFLTTNGADTSGPANPANGVPYYLLIVGSPIAIPYSFQYQLDVQYAVGRIWFDSAEEYALYAQSVVNAETGKIFLPRKATFFAVETDGDRATEASARNLVQPLYEKMKQKQPLWDMNLLRGYGNTTQNILPANHSHLEHLMGGTETPAFLFTASHGMGFPLGDNRMLPHQGALLCQDWKGPQSGTIPESAYFAGDHIASDANLGGLIAFFFACYGAGCPQYDDFYHQAFDDITTQVAPHPFIARLPSRMLTRGALAVVGHVERAWGFSFLAEGVESPQIATFTDAVAKLMDGLPVGEAIDPFNVKYAEVSTELMVSLNKGQQFDPAFGFTPPPEEEFELAIKWTQLNDARNYAIVGDPAVRLPTRDDTSVPIRPLLNIDTSMLKPISTELTLVKSVESTEKSVLHSCSTNKPSSAVLQQPVMSVPPHIQQLTDDIATQLELVAPHVLENTLYILRAMIDNIAKR